MASEEMDLARRLTWNELSRVTPWTDAYVAISPTGYEITMERHYVWTSEARDAIRVEIRARTMYGPSMEALEEALVTPKGFE